HRQHDRPRQIQRRSEQKYENADGGDLGNAPPHARRRQGTELFDRWRWWLALRLVGTVFAHALAPGMCSTTNSEPIGCPAIWLPPWHSDWQTNRLEPI